MSNCCLKICLFQLFHFFMSNMILNNMFVVVVLYCVQLFFGSIFCPKSFSSPFFSFANTVLFFTFLAPFFWNSQND